jgi:ComF family protein
MEWLLNNLLNILFPKFCISCDKEGKFLCEECFYKIKKFKNPVIVERNSSRGKKNHLFKKLIIPCPYHQNPILEKAVHKMKYTFYKDLAKPLSKLLIETIIKQKLPKETCIVPIPLHRKREKFRGFNQSLLLAEHISNACGFKIIHLILRSKNTKVQANLNREQRIENLKNAFIFNTAVKIPNKHTPILIIDDICTTLSTLSQAAKTLQKQGYNVIFGAALAKA